MEKKDLIKKILEDGEEAFVDNYLFAMPPAAFNFSLVRYDEFLEEISEILSIPKSSVILVGSGRLGFSINPDHLGRDFNPQSDLDLIIHDSDRFDKCWEELLQQESEFLLDSETRKLIKKIKDNHFYGYFRPDKLPLNVKLSKEFFPLLAGPFMNPVAKVRDVKAWVFKGNVFSKAFYSNNVRRIADGISKILRSLT